MSLITRRVQLILEAKGVWLADTCHGGDGCSTPLSCCRTLEIPSEAQKLADAKNFELKGYRFTASPEQTRAPRIVRMALVQNSIPCPTTDPVPDQVRYIAK